MKLKMTESKTNVFKQAKEKSNERRAERAKKAGPRQLEAMRKNSLAERDATAARDKRLGKTPKPAAATAMAAPKPVATKASKPVAPARNATRYTIAGGGVRMISR